MGRVEQNWDNSDPWQRWTLTHMPDGYFRLVNEKTGNALALDDSAEGRPVILGSPTAEQHQQWRLEPALTL